MFKDLRPYEESVDSGALWLGSVPSHWNVAGARSVFAEVASSGHVDEPLLSVTISRGVLRQSDLLANSGKKDSSNLDRSKYKLVEPGDIAYNKMRAWQGAIGLSQHRGIVSPAYVVIRPRRDSGTYLHHLLRTPRFAKEAERWSYGITSDQWSLRPEHFKMITFPVPPVNEQAAIVKYLTHAHARIDRAIAAKRRIGLLIDEQRQAITRRLLTCTSDGDPANCQYVPAGRLCKITTGVEDSRNAVPDGEYPFYVRGREILRASDYIMDAEAVMTPGDGQGGVGKVFHYFNGKFQAHQRVYIFSDFDGVDGRFFYWHLSSFFHRFALSRSNTVTMESLRLPVLASFPVAVPSLSEQRKIVSRIEAEDAHAQAVRLTVQRQIELLREFRMRLTSDVVTGQLDVRHIAAALPNLDPASDVEDVGADQDDLEAEVAEITENVYA